MRIENNTKIIRTGASEVKEVEDELSERCIEGSGIFLIWAGRPIMMNSVLEGLRRRRLDVPLPPIPDVSRVSSLSALGVVLRGDLDAHDHISVALASCSRSLYALCTLRSRGLPSLALALHEVTRATTL